jgi:hypothetical protein
MDPRSLRFVLCTLSACGTELTLDPPAGGALDTDDPGQAITEPVPTPAGPQVLQGLPPDGALVTPEVVIRIAFSEPMTPLATVIAFNVTSIGGDVIDGAPAWDTAAQVLAFRPIPALSVGEYVVTVDERATSATGMALVEPFGTTFTVGEPDPGKGG